MTEDPAQGDLAERLRRAATVNFRLWQVRLALVAGGRAARRPGSVSVTGPGPADGVAIPFPRWSEDGADRELDAILDSCRAATPLRAVECGLAPCPEPPDLAARLAARGFEPGISTLWMGLDLGRLRRGQRRPPGLRIRRLDLGPGDTPDLALWSRWPHPYFGPPGEARDANVAARLAAARARPRRIAHFVAWLDGVPVGHSTAHLTTGPDAAAGIYDVGVLRDHRNRGIGTAVTAAACAWARRQGLGLAVLGASPLGAPVYRRLGFESIGTGVAWEAGTSALAAEPASPAQRRFTAAVGRGDVAALQAMAAEVSRDMLDGPMAPGTLTSPLRLASFLRREAAARWLLARGATPDVVALWELGWRDEARDALAGNPSLANLVAGPMRITPLHHAALRNDPELARAVLTAGPDLTVRDPRYGGTPLGWALEFERTEIAEMIRQRSGQPTGTPAAP